MHSIPNFHSELAQDQGNKKAHCNHDVRVTLRRTDLSGPTQVTGLGCASAFLQFSCFPHRHRPCSHSGRAPYSQEAHTQYPDPSRIVPDLNRCRPGAGRHPHEQERPNAVANHREHGAFQTQNEATPPAELEEFSQEKGDHQGRLQRSDAAARLLHADSASAHRDRAALNHRRRSAPSEHFRDHTRIPLGERSNQRPFQARRPWDRDEDVADWKGASDSQRTLPGLPPSTRAVQKKHRYSDGFQRERPTEQAPIRVRFLEQANREDEQKRCGCQTDDASAGTFGLLGRFKRVKA